MHPALSIIVFTTLSGAGYGLLFVVGLAVPAGLIAPSPGLGIAVMGVGLVLVVGGAGVIDLPFGASGTGLARALPMAVVLAVA